MNHHARRRQRFARLLKDEKLGAFLVTNPLNALYLTGFTGGSSFVIITSKRTILVTDTRFSIQVAEECPDLETAIRGPNKTTCQLAAEVLEKLGLQTVGVESQHLTIANFDALENFAKSIDFVAKNGLVESLRVIKDESEITAIREAIEYGKRAFKMMQAMLSATDTEKEVADALDSYIRRAGGHGTSFETIVAVGDRSALPHCPPSSRRIAEGDFMLVDWGARGPLYTSDLTRVIRSPFFAERKGRQRVESKLQKIYTVVLQAQRRAIAAVRPGVAAKDVDAATRSYIADAGYGNAFNHGLGHGIGLQVHEGPDIRSTSTDVLEAGMVFTLEPGVYIEGFGGVRLEDNILVTPDGCEVLSSGVPIDF
ncbi:MAG: Xaa-Pro peptidase family protein [Planctomycetes bacterium]|nr:Xaa-Pro peptidase family protein [Planctomycetota bacterium]